MDRSDVALVSATWEIRQGDVLDRLGEMADESVQCCITSPPYYGLRDYGVEGQIGLEETPDGYVRRLVEVFAEVKRVLRSDGTLWLNLGDSYSHANGYKATHAKRSTGCKPKDLLGVPWMVAFALRADGWYLRRDIIWSKRQNVLKHRAHQAVWRGLRYGRLVRPEACERCGSAHRRLEAHHHDYAKPLDVEWLCPSCHRREG